MRADPRTQVLDSLNSALSYKARLSLRTVFTPIPGSSVVTCWGWKVRDSCEVCPKTPTVPYGASWALRAGTCNQDEFQTPPTAWAGPCQICGPALGLAPALTRAPLCAAATQRSSLGLKHAAHSRLSASAPALSTWSSPHRLLGRPQLPRRHPKRLSQGPWLMSSPPPHKHLVSPPFLSPNALTRSEMTL